MLLWLKESWGIWMEDKLLKKYRFLAHTMFVFSIMVLSILIPGSVMGETAKSYSSFFALAPQGISYASLWQMLGASTAISFLETVIFESRLFERMMTLYKTILMVALIIVVIIIFVVLFGWFPLDMPSAWISFIASFLVCFGVSTLVMVTKTKRESKEFERLLGEYKEKREGDQ